MSVTYHWTFAIRFGGPHRPIYPKHIQNTWQPVVSFSRRRPAAETLGISRRTANRNWAFARAATRLDPAEALRPSS